MLCWFRARRTFRERNCDPVSVENAAGDVTAASHCVVDGRRHGQAGLHPLVDRIADDPIRTGVLDGAEVELSFLGLDSISRRNTSWR
jgi:hypothetical protein